MSENRRQLLKDAMDNKETYRIPMGFWHHFVLGKDQFQGLEHPEILEKIVEGHKRYFETIEPDMMKLMNEGFMGYPPIMNNSTCPTPASSFPAIRELVTTAIRFSG